MHSESALPRGLRNHNPGNIRRSPGVRYRGERIPSDDPDFRQFEAPEWGYRALFVLLYTYGRRYGLRTPRQLVTRWAPPAENDTAGYVAALCRRAELDPDAPLDLLDGSVMRPFAAAMSAVENGRAADSGAVARGWELFFGDFGRK